MNFSASGTAWEYSGYWLDHRPQYQTVTLHHTFQYAWNFWWTIWKVSVTRSCLTLRDPVESSPPGSSVHGILQARILEWVAIPFFRGSSQPSNQTWVSCIADRFFTVWLTREAPNMLKYIFVFLFLHLSCLEFITSPSVNFSCLQKVLFLKAVIRLGPLR